MLGLDECGQVLTPLFFVNLQADFGELAGILYPTMKTRIWLFMLLIALGITACEYDDSALKADVDDLNDRLTALETQVDRMNADIVSLQDLIQQIDQQICIASVEETADGYILRFTDGNTVTLRHGKDGADGTDGKDGADGTPGASGNDGTDGKDAPVIGIAREKGIYYWTLTAGDQTSWLTDEAGNKLPVTGTAGITPMLGIDKEGYWTVSYDGGTTYTQLTDTEGHPVQAVGKDGKPGESGNPGATGDSFFQSVTQDSEKVILVLSDGTIIQIPKAQPFAITFRQTENILLGTDVVELTYTLTGADADTQIRAFVSKGDLTVTVKSVSFSKGTISVQRKEGASAEGSEIIVLLFNKEKTITTLLTFADAPDRTDTNGNTEGYNVEEGVWDN